MRKGKGHVEHEEEHENHEAWVIPYADMITLLMGLFIVMWSIGTADLAKLEDIRSGFASSLGMGVSAAGPATGGDGVLDGIERPSLEIERLLAETQVMTPDRFGDAVDALEREEQQAEARAAESAQLAEVERAITEHARTSGVAEVIDFRHEDRGLVVSIVSDQVLFDPGSASLRSDGRDVLDGLAEALLGLPNHVAIEGHTDSVPIANAQFPSNWELSTARATSVLQYFLEAYAFPPDRLTASGYAEQRPLADNATAAGRSKNRRVDIAVLSMEPHGGGDQP
ncbi:MAG: flagellar motor protein MotB [Acidimicrobiales bacterium]